MINHSTGSEWGSTGRWRRLWIYIQEMFPLYIRVPLNLVNFLYIYVGLQLLQNVGPVQFSWISLVGALTVQLLWFFIRVFDELKDAESDIALARAGDERFQNRPIVTGKVKIEDISILRWWMVTTVIALHIPFISPSLMVGLAIAMGYLTLSYKWFFWPAIRDHVLIVFVTHAPNALVIQIYTASVFVAEFGMPGIWSSILLLLSLWATVAAFEFSYKIRAPSDETALMTYSKRLGTRTATMICIAFLLLSIGCALATSYVSGLPWYVALVIGMIGVWALNGCTRFLRHPSPENAILTHYVGLYWWASCVLFVAAALLQSGISISS